MNLQRIKLKAEELKYPGGIKSLAKVAGMTEANLHRCVRENKIQAYDLEKIANALGVSVAYFFEEKYNLHVREAGRDYVEKGRIEHKGPEYNGSGSTEADLREQIAILKSQLADKERIISLMEKQQSNN